MRTQAEIIAQIEARYAEMEAIARSPAMQFPCSTCRWSTSADEIFARCHHPLIKGFEKEGILMRIDRDKIALCGQEKALWEPPLPVAVSWWQEVLEALKVWLGKPD